MRGKIKRPDQDKKQRINLPRIGMIKTGFKGAKGFPQSTDYFIPSGKYESMFRKAYGEKPQTIHVVFLEDDPEAVCNERYEYRDKEGRLFATGDGEEFKVWTGDVYEDFSIEKYPDLMSRVEKKNPNGGKGWEVILTLNFILPKIRGVVGCWSFSTKGELSSIPQIRDTFHFMLENKGQVRGIIFDLTVQFAKSQKPNSKSKYPVVSLVPNESEDNIEMIKKSMIQIGSPNQKQIEQ